MERATDATKGENKLRGSYAPVNGLNMYYEITA